MTWHWADGKIDGAELVVSSKNVHEHAALTLAHHPQRRQEAGPGCVIGEKFGPFFIHLCSPIGVESGGGAVG